MAKSFVRISSLTKTGGYYSGIAYSQSSSGATVVDADCWVKSPNSEVLELATYYLAIRYPVVNGKRLYVTQEVCCADALIVGSCPGDAACSAEWPASLNLVGYDDDTPQSPRDFSMVLTYTTSLYSFGGAGWEGEKPLNPIFGTMVYQWYCGGLESSLPECLKRRRMRYFEKSSPGSATVMTIDGTYAYSADPLDAYYKKNAFHYVYLSE